MQVVPYLIFNGNAEEALEFYAAAFGGETSVMRFSEMPPVEGMNPSEAWKNKIMHAEVSFDKGHRIYVSDAFEGNTVTVGDNASVHVDVDSEEDVRRYFDALSSGGRVTMPVETQFWGAVYGSLVDKYGVGWGFHYQLPG